MADREPTREDIQKLIRLTRRALARLDAPEARVATVEKRLHWLDDIPETVEGLTSLASRVAIDDDIRRILNEGLKPEIDPEEVTRTISTLLPPLVRQEVNRIAQQALQVRITNAVDKQLRKRGL